MPKIHFILLALLLTVNAAFADIPEPVTPKGTSQSSGFDGAALYANNCATCHGDLEQTRIPDRRPARIASAIRNLGVMGDLKHLSALEVIAIARVLVTETPSSSRR